MSALERVSRNKMFGGFQDVYRHESSSLGCNMNVAVYLPAQAEQGPCPTLYWLSGLTCTEQNFTTKAGAQQFAAEHGIILIAPDTSPRGDDLQGNKIADDEAYDLGQGAGFYVNATQAPWSAHFRMYDYIVTELPDLIEANFAVNDQRGIFGHSMGGHGALTIALKNPGRYQSVSAFSPIVAPTQCPWGEKAFSAYLGDDQALWRQHDACELVANASEKLPILIDQGDADDFLVSQLKPELLQQACDSANHPLTLRMQPGYDHSYYFIASFIGDHFAHHAQALKIV